MAEQKTQQEGTANVSARPKEQTDSEALQQAKEDALSPEDKHKNYLEDLERLHGESVVDARGNTPRAG
jgi:hypothetical protein